MIEYTIILPVYNQEKNLSGKFTRFIIWINNFISKNPEMKDKLEILFSEDGSTDKSHALIQEYAGRFKCDVHILHGRKRLGKGGGFRKGFLEARGKYVILYDLDMSVSPDQIPHLINGLKKGYDIVMGSRNHRDSRFYNFPTFTRFIFAQVMGAITRLLFFVPFGETQCGFKGFHKEKTIDIIENMEITGWIFDLEILFKSYCKHLKILEIPVNFFYVKESKINNYRDPIFIVQDLLRLRLKILKSYPLPFFRRRRNTITK
ncbi:MAG: glycosyltransferase [Promethearchaeota archaeon]